uniref:Uncharacterized protein n=1 Tax=Panagrolaimus davidi TaxID=227884 RepID=A0A914P859_9BILA
MFFLAVIFSSILSSVAPSKCYFSAFYISESPTNFVDCYFSKGNFCYAKASLENPEHFRYGCDTAKRITEELCDYRQNCSNFSSNLCCCKSDGCNHISDKYGEFDDFENVTFISRLPSPIRPPDRRHLNYVTVGILVVASIACIITYFPVISSVRSSIQSLKRTEEYYINSVQSGTIDLKTAKKINKILQEILFLEEFIFRLNTLRRFEELSDDTFVKSPRKKNTKVLQKLENDPQFLHMIQAYALTRKETLKRRALIKRRQKKSVSKI